MKETNPSIVKDSPFEQLNRIQKIIRFFEPAESILPRSIRVPFRYYAQQIVGALEPEMKLLKDLVPSEGVAIDIGANRGIYAYALSKIASKVECFEPIPKCAEYIKSYPSKKIIVHNKALSDRAGVMDFYIPILNGRTTLTRASLARPKEPYTSMQIEISTLDAFAFPKVDFIKIDVEGFEAAVIKGAKDTLSRCHPKLLIEIDHNRNTPEQFAWIFSFLHGLGYTPYTLHGNKMIECKDPVAESKVLYNFIFLPK